MTVQNHTSNMYHDALHKVTQTRLAIDINDKINLKTLSRIGMNGVLKFYAFNFYNRSSTLNKSK